jgi:hypothetical protein
MTVEEIKQKLLEIEFDAKDTLEQIEIYKDDPYAPKDSWADGYMYEVMKNVIWLIEQVKTK